MGRRGEEKEEGARGERRGGERGSDCSNDAIRINKYVATHTITTALWLARCYKSQPCWRAED